MKYSKDVIPTWYQNLRTNTAWISWDTDLRDLEVRLTIFKSWGARIHCRPKWDRFGKTWKTVLFKQ